MTSTRPGKRARKKRYANPKTAPSVKLVSDVEQVEDAAEGIVRVEPAVNCEELEQADTSAPPSDSSPESERPAACDLALSSNLMPDSDTAAAPLNAPAFQPPVPPSAVLPEVTKVAADAAKHSISFYLGVCLDWAWTMRAPLLILTAIALCPKLILLWVLIIIAKPVSLFLYRHCPEKWKARYRLSLPPVLRNSQLFRDLNEGVDQGLPFILFWLYICCAPFAIIWMTGHWIRGWFSRSCGDEPPLEGFQFTQNKRPDSAHSETNFYHSRAFAIVLFTFFLLGIPAFFTYGVYQWTGMEQMVRSSPVSNRNPNAFSLLPATKVPRVGLATRPDPRKPKKPSKRIFSSESFLSQEPALTFNTAVTGYVSYWPYMRNLGLEPTPRSMVFVHFYLMSLGTALCILFFRAWFLFPLNFLSTEHDVEFTGSGIRRRTLKSWFMSVVTINGWSIGSGPDSLRWNEVKSLRRVEEGYTRLYPLPETAFKKESLSYKLLNKCAALLDGLTHRPNKGNYLIFSSTESGPDFGNNIKLNLNDLSREQRVRLFYAVKQWAPHIVIDERAEEQLLGSTVLKNERYTQLWFDMLTSRTRSKRKNTLSSGDKLKKEEYTIDDRLSSGGQATTYLATRSSGEKCVLKEFVLATSSNSAALLESAREFEAEVSLLTQLKHPGIVKLEDFFCEDGRVYVVLEYIAGQSLRQKVQQEGPLSEQEVARISTSLCEVLEYLHGSTPPIVHRDITPENILVELNGTVKLIDFSLAVKQDGRQTTDSCAKQAFTPPEQFQENTCTQSDIYALGATMFFMLTGKTPKPISVSSPTSRAPDVSPEMNAIVERATQLDLKQRYEAVNWLKLDLTKFAKE